MPDDEKRIISPLTESQHNRSPIHLSTPLTHPDAPDFILDDVRNRYLEIARAMALGAKDLRVDVSAVVVPTPQGLQVQLLMLMSISSPLLGTRIQTSAAVDNYEPKDEMLRQVAENLYNALMDARMKMLTKTDGPAQGGLQVPGR